MENDGHLGSPPLAREGPYTRAMAKRAKAMRRANTDPETEPRRFPAFLSGPVRQALARLSRSGGLATHWQEGRQGTGYEKLDLRAALEADAFADERSLLETVLTQARVSFGVPILMWDAYFIRYREGAFVPEHRDPTGTSKHLRLNALLAAAEDGTGQLRLSGNVFDLAEGDAVLFRPDVIDHSVSTVLGERALLSVGCVVKDSE